MLPAPRLQPGRQPPASGGKRTQPGTAPLFGERAQVPGRQQVRKRRQRRYRLQVRKRRQRGHRPRERKHQYRLRPVLLQQPRLRLLPQPPLPELQGRGCWLLQFLLGQPRGLPPRSGLLLFRRISDCLSPLKVFRLEGNTHVLHHGLTGRASYFRENESIVTGSTGAPSVSLLPGVIPAAAIVDTASRPDVTFPTTV